MKTIKQYIKNHKQLIIIYLGAITFLFVHNYAYCHPIILTLITPAISYFSSLSPEFYAGKIIDKVFEMSPFVINKAIEFAPYAVTGTGKLVLGTLATAGGIKIAELGYNWRFFANQYAQSTPIIGSLLKGANITYKWFTNKELTNIEYTPFYPKIASAFGYPHLFDSKLELNLSNFEIRITPNTSNQFIAEQPEPLIVQVPIETVYTRTEQVIVDRHNEDVLRLSESVDRLENRIQQESLIRANLKSDEDLLNELQRISLLEEYPTYTREQLRAEFKDFKMSMARETEGAYTTNQRIQYIKFQENRDVIVKYDTGVDTRVNIDQEKFSQMFPTLYDACMTLASIRYSETRGIFGMTGPLYIYFVPKYNIIKGLWGLVNKYEYSPENSIICQYYHSYEERNTAPIPQVTGFDEEWVALDKMRSHQLQNVTLVHNEISTLTDEIRASIVNNLHQNNPQDTTAPEETAINLEQNPEIGVGIEPTTMITPTITHTAGAAISVGLVSLLTTQDVFTVLSYLLTNNPLVPLVHNPAVAQALVELYTNNGISLPSYLQSAAVNNDLATIAPQVTEPAVANPASTLNNTIHFPWNNLITVVLIGGVVIGGVYLWKHTGDTSALQAVSFENELLKGLK